MYKGQSDQRNDHQFSNQENLKQCLKSMEGTLLVSPVSQNTNYPSQVIKCTCDKSVADQNEIKKLNQKNNHNKKNCKCEENLLPSSSINCNIPCQCKQSKQSFHSIEDDRVLPHTKQSPQSCSCEIQSSVGTLPVDSDKIVVDQNDAIYVEKISQLLKSEQQLNKEIKDLDRAQKYIEHHAQSKQTDSDLSGSGDYQVHSLKRLNEKLVENNHILVAEVEETLANIKHLRENIEEPIRNEIEIERNKIKLLEEKARHLDIKRLSEKKEVEFVRDQLEQAKQYLTDLNMVNKRLKEELCMLTSRCNELQTDIINQKLSEIHTISRLHAQKHRFPPHVPSKHSKHSKGSSGDGGDDRGGRRNRRSDRHSHSQHSRSYESPTSYENPTSKNICPKEKQCPNKHKQSKTPERNDNDLDVIAENLSTLLAQANECKACQCSNNDLIDTVKYIKDLIDMLNKDSASSSESLPNCECGDVEKILENPGEKQSEFKDSDIPLVNSKECQSCDVTNDTTMERPTRDVQVPIAKDDVSSPKPASQKTERMSEQQLLSCLIDYLNVQVDGRDQPIIHDVTTFDINVNEFELQSDNDDYPNLDKLDRPVTSDGIPRQLDIGKNRTSTSVKSGKSGTEHHLLDQEGKIDNAQKKKKGEVVGSISNRKDHAMSSKCKENMEERMKTDSELHDNVEESLDAERFARYSSVDEDEIFILNGKGNQPVIAKGTPASQLLDEQGEVILNKQAHMLPSSHVLGTIPPLTAVDVETNKTGRCILDQQNLNLIEIKLDKHEDPLLNEQGDMVTPAGHVVDSTTIQISTGIKLDKYDNSILDEQGCLLQSYKQECTLTPSEHKLNTTASPIPAGIEVNKHVKQIFDELGRPLPFDGAPIHLKLDKCKQPTFDKQGDVVSVRYHVLDTIPLPVMAPLPLDVYNKPILNGKDCLLKSNDAPNDVMLDVHGQTKIDHDHLLMAHRSRIIDQDPSATLLKQVGVQLDENGQPMLNKNGSLERDGGTIHIDKHGHSLPDFEDNILGKNVVELVPLPEAEELTSLVPTPDTKPVRIISRSTEGNYITTALASACALHLTTEGPAGLIDTTVKITDSGHVQVHTDMTEFGEQELMDTQFVTTSNVVNDESKEGITVEGLVYERYEDEYERITTPECEFSEDEVGEEGEDDEEVEQNIIRIVHSEKATDNNNKEERELEKEFAVKNGLNVIGPDLRSTPEPSVKILGDDKEILIPPLCEMEEGEIDDEIKNKIKENRIALLPICEMEEVHDKPMRDKTNEILPAIICNTEQSKESLTTESEKMRPSKSDKACQCTGINEIGRREEKEEIVGVDKIIDKNVDLNGRDQEEDIITNNTNEPVSNIQICKPDICASGERRDDVKYICECMKAKSTLCEECFRHHDMKYPKIQLDLKISCEQPCKVIKSRTRYTDSTSSEDSGNIDNTRGGGRIKPKSLNNKYKPKSTNSSRKVCVNFCGLERTNVTCKEKSTSSVLNVNNADSNAQTCIAFKDEEVDPMMGSNIKLAMNSQIVENKKVDRETSVNCCPCLKQTSTMDLQTNSQTSLYNTPESNSRSTKIEKNYCLILECTCSDSATSFSSTQENNSNKTSFSNSCQCPNCKCVDDVESVIENQPYEIDTIEGAEKGNNILDCCLCSTCLCTTESVDFLGKFEESESILEDSSCTSSTCIEKGNFNKRNMNNKQCLKCCTCMQESLSTMHSIDDEHWNYKQSVDCVPKCIRDDVRISAEITTPSHSLIGDGHPKFTNVKSETSEIEKTIDSLKTCIPKTCKKMRITPSQRYCSLDTCKKVGHLSRDEGVGEPMKQPGHKELQIQSQRESERRSAEDMEEGFDQLPEITIKGGNEVSSNKEYTSPSLQNSKLSAEFKQEWSVSSVKASNQPSEHESVDAAKESKQQNEAGSIRSDKANKLPMGEDSINSVKVPKQPSEEKSVGSRTESIGFDKKRHPTQIPIKEQTSRSGTVVLDEDGYRIPTSTKDEEAADENGNKEIHSDDSVSSDRDRGQMSKSSREVDIAVQERPVERYGLEHTDKEQRNVDVQSNIEENSRDEKGFPSIDSDSIKLVDDAHQLDQVEKHTASSSLGDRSAIFDEMGPSTSVKQPRGKESTGQIAEDDQYSKAEDIVDKRDPRDDRSNQTDKIHDDKYMGKHGNNEAKIDDSRRDSERDTFDKESLIGNYAYVDGASPRNSNIRKKPSDHTGIIRKPALSLDEESSTDNSCSFQGSLDGLCCKCNKIHSSRC